MKTIDITELKEKLDYLDLRAVRNWCKRNDVLIIKQGKMEFVIESNFEEVYEKPFINKLKRQFGDDWVSTYRLYKEGNITALNILQTVPNVQYKIYRPTGKTKNKFQEKLDAYKKGSVA